MRRVDDGLEVLDTVYAEVRRGREATRVLLRLDERRALLDEVAFEKRVFEGDGDSLFRPACSLGLEGIISKRRTSPYRSGKSDDWRKIMCPEYRRRRGKWMVLRPPDPVET